MEDASKSGAYEALKLPNFRKFIIARFFLTLAIQIQGITLAIFIYELTSDPLALGLIGLAEVIPNLMVSLLGGYISDNYNRKKVLMVCSTLLFLSALAFVGLTSADLTKSILVNALYGVVMITGIARGFFFPSSFAFFTSLIPKHLYSNAATWNSSAWQIASIAGPALGGLIYGLTNPTICFVIVSALLLCAPVLYSLIPYTKQNISKQDREPIFLSLREGWKYVWDNKIILSALSLDMFAVLLGGAEALLPVFAKDILHINKFQLGILRAAPALGAILMAFIMAYRTPTKMAGRNILLAVGAFGIAIVAFGVSRNYYLSFIALFISGAADNISVVIRTTILQTFTPENMRGRIAAINAMFISSSNELGAFESGLTARLFGASRAVIAGGILTLTVVSSMALKAKKFRELKM